MLTLRIDIPDDLEKQLYELEGDYQEFILDAMRRRFDQLDTEVEYDESCRTSCFANFDHLPENEKEGDWEVL